MPHLRDPSAAGGRVVRLPSGHLVLYGAHGRRILATDPDGHPLHECEWRTAPDGTAALARARIRLDWDQWVGIKPEGLVNATALDLSRKPGWQKLTADDLRQMAAQALQVPIGEVRFFYGDDDLVIDRRGQATIRHRKDAFYVLDDGTFERARFMACMGAMHWARIDFLPVVELFQSLLPGTGSATFELIRGLYDDQNRDEPLPLRYRGIPTYPSEAAFRLFSAFFTPQGPGGSDPFPVFMDVPRSHEVTWLPVPDQPRRYFDEPHRLCLTVKGGLVQKVTVADDPTGLPYVAAGPHGFAPCDRSVHVAQGKLVLKEGERSSEIPISPIWGNLHETLAPKERGEGSWRALFGGPPPAVTPSEAYSAVLLYPDDDREIDEAGSQPFVADYLEDLVEQRPELAGKVAQASRILIDGFDAALDACIRLDRPRDYTVLYRHPALAQKQAQNLWNKLAQAQRLDRTRRITFLPAESSSRRTYEQQHDLIYQWGSFARFDQQAKLTETVGAIAAALKPGGFAFAVGPTMLAPLMRARGLRVLRSEPVESLPTFRMHRTILPQARLKPGLTLFHLTKS
ncbi:MAG: hypothetical protein AB1411_08545 [Nitrospirota bacterium]